MHLLPYRPGCTSPPLRTWGNVPLRNSTCSKLWWWLENRWDLKAFDQWTGFHFTDLKTTSEAWTLERGVVLYATRFVSKGELLIWITLQRLLLTFPPTYRHLLGHKSSRGFEFHLYSWTFLVSSSSWLIWEQNSALFTTFLWEDKFSFVPEFWYLQTQGNL